VKNMPRILVINGANLNMLGTREPEIYGHETLVDIENNCKDFGRDFGLRLDFFQSNSEGEIINKIHSALNNYHALIINAGAYTHTSIGIMDALLLLKIPVIEVHLSNIFRREHFRHESYISKAAKGVICGFGSGSYILALQAAANFLGK
jgi:3-dehydroquinate dehydratase-2